MNLRSPGRRRSWLLFTSALGGLVASGAAAQGVPTPTLPTRTDVESTKINGLPVLGEPGIANGSGRLDVTLNSSSTVINWKKFDVPDNQTINFARNPLVGDAAVLNRVTGTTATDIRGTLSSNPRVSVWVLNPNGILVGSKAVINTGSLVLSTLDIDPDRFIAANNSYRLTGPAGSSSGITIANGAQITVEGGRRGLVMVAPAIDADGSFKAVDQDVAFVTATDVTLTYDNNSPLSITLTRGTSVPGRSQYIRGQVEGNDAIFALASRETVTDALLRVDASVTTARAGTRGIVLSAGRPAVGASGVTVDGTAADAGGVGSVEARGALTTLDQDGGSDILSGATGTGTFTGALTTARDVALSAGGALTVAGDVTAGRGYILSGAGVTLGGDTAAVQAATGSVSITSTGGDIVGNADLSLSSGGGSGIVLRTGGASAGNILFDRTSTLAAGTGRRGDLLIARRDAANQVTLGNVSANALTGSVGAGQVTPLSVSGALTLGDVDTRQALSITAGGITAGALASDGGVELTSTAGIAAASIAARGGSARLTADGTVAVATTLAASGNVSDVRVSTPGSVTLGGISAGRDIRIGDAVAVGAATISGAVAAAGDYVVNGGTVNLGSGVPVTQQARGAVTITGGAGGVTGASGLTLAANSNGNGRSALTLQIDPASAGGGPGGAINFAAATTLKGGSNRQSDVRIGSADANGSVTLGNVQAAALQGAVGGAAFANGLTRNGAITVGNVSVIAPIALTGNGIATGALTSGGAITLEAGTGALATAGNLSAGGALTLKGGSVTLGGASAESGGAIDILARTGGIASTDALALTSTSTRAADFVRLQASGAEGISFASGSAITAGAAKALRVAVYNGTAGAPLTLGAVTARSLGALSTLDGDATVTAGAITAAGSLSFGALDLSDSFAAASKGGDLTIGRLAVTGQGQGIDLQAAQGRLLVQNTLSASGDVTLVSGGELRLGTVESRDGRTSVTSGGDIRLGTLNGKTAVTATGAAVTIGTVGGGDIQLNAGGDLSVTSIAGTSVSARAGGALTASGDVVGRSGAVSLSATGALTGSGLVAADGGALIAASSGGPVSLTGGSRASGDTTLAGASIELGGAHQANGAFTARSAAGAITGSAGLSILADANGAGGKALTLAATGGALSLDRNSTLTGGSNRTGAVVLSTTGAEVGIGTVRAGTLSVAAADGTPVATITAGDITVSGGLDLAAAQGIDTGAIAGGTAAVSLQGGTGLVKARGITATGNVAASGSGLDLGAVNARDLTATATAGDVRTGDLTLSGDLRARATDGLVSLGVVRAGGVDLNATGTITTRDLLATGALMLAGDAIELGRVEGATLTATARTGDLSGGDVVVGGDVSGIAEAGAVTLGSVRSNTGGISLAAAATLIASGDVAAGAAASLSGADVRVGNIDAASLNATAKSGALTTGNVTTTGAARLDAAGLVRTGQITTTRGDVSVTGGAPVTLGGITSGGTAAVTAGGVVSDVVITAGLDAVEAASVTASGNIRAPFIRSRTGALSVRAPRGDVTGLDPSDGIALGAGAGRAVTLAVGRAVRLGDIVGGKIDISATSISTGRIDAGTESLALQATDGDLFVGGSVVGGDVTLRSTGQTRLQSVDASGALSLGGGAGLSFSRVSGKTVAIEGGAISGGVVRSDGVLTATGRSIDVRQAIAGGALSLKSADGILNVSEKATGASIEANGAGRINIASAQTAGALSLTGGENIGFGTLDAGTIRIDATGAVQGTTALARGDVAITGASVVLADATAGQALTIKAAGDIGSTGTLTSASAGLVAGGALRLNVLDAGSATLDGGTGLQFGTVTGGALDVRSGGAISGDRIAGSGVAVSGTGLTLREAGATGNLALQATGGDLAVTGLASGGAVTLGATGLLDIASADATRSLTLTGGSARFGQLTAPSITVSSAGRVEGTRAVASRTLAITGDAVRIGDASGDTSVALTATGGALDVTGSARGGAVTLNAKGAATIAEAVATGPLMVRGDTGLSFGTLQGGSIQAVTAGTLAGTSVTGTGKGNVSLSGASIALTDVRAGGDLAVTATAGDLTIVEQASGDTVGLSASGRADVAAANATGNLTLSGNAVGFGTLDAGTIRVASTGAVQGRRATSSGGAEIRGSAVTLNEVRAGGTADVAASSGDLSLTSATTGSDALFSAAGQASISGAVASGGAYRVTGGSVSLGAQGVVQKAAGEVRITSTANDITGVAGLVLASDADASTGAEPLILDSAGGIVMAGTRLQARPGGGAPLALRAGAGRSVRLGIVEAGSIVGWNGTQASGPASFDASFTADDVTTGGIGITLTGGDLSIGRLNASGAVALRTNSGGIALGDVRSGTLDLNSSGALSATAITATGNAALSAGSMTLGSVTAPVLAVRSTGDVGGANGGRTSLASTSGSLTLEARNARLGTVSSAGTATLTADGLDVAGRLSAARDLLATARQALSVNDTQSGGATTLKAGGALQGGALDAAGALTAEAAGINVTGARSGGVLTLTSSRDLTIARSGSGNGISLASQDLTTVGELNGGPTIAIKAGDVALGGPVRATSVTFTTARPATTATRIGDGTANDGLRLSAAELNQVTADTLRVEAGSGALEIGAINLAEGAGRTLDLLSTGDVRVTGPMAAAGNGRQIRIGGTADGGRALSLYVASTSDAGGRLLLGGSDVELRADRIAVGLAQGFIDTLAPGEAGRAQAAQLVGNGNSPLYNPQFGGGFFDPNATTTLSARSLTVRFNDFALFQNTGVPGQSSGLVLGGTVAQPVSPALVIRTPGAPGTASFGFFGTVNGVGGAGTALLGPGVIDIDPALLSTSRINGCLAGSGAGCLTTIVIQPTLQVFRWDSEDVFGISQDVNIPFQPIVGGGDDKPLSDLPPLPTSLNTTTGNPKP